MTDVRLTALNPEDSKVYPVACNSSGELLTTKGSDINLDVPGNLDVGGSATFASDVTVGNNLQVNSSGKFYRPTSKGGDVAGNALLTLDSDVYGVAKNALSITTDGSINAAGSSTFAGRVTGGSNNFGSTAVSTEAGLFYNNSSGQYPAVLARNIGGGSTFRGINPAGAVTIDLEASGNATFTGDVIVGSRGEKWLIRESNGVAMLVQQARRGAKEPLIEEVRDLPRELDLIETALSEIMEKLRMTPPAGWPVWDGSDNSQ